MSAPASGVLVLALAQVNPVIGDLDANVASMRTQVERARRAGAQLVLFGELAVCGYPPEDLLLRSDFLAACHRAVDAVADSARGIAVAFGAPLNGPRDLHNSLVLAADGRVRAVYEKRHLPHYGVFDEGRYFGAGSGSALVRLGGHLVGLSVCADLWVGDGPATEAARAGAELILNASASPFHTGKAAERETMLGQRARDVVCPIAYANVWGGQDELVFDGGSMVVDHCGRVVARAGQFADDLLVVPLDLRPVRAARLRDPRLRSDPPGAAGAGRAEPIADVRLRSARARGALAAVAPVLVREQELWRALCTGVADWVVKHGHDHVVVGLGGGIDSSVVATLACDALGADRVTAVVMPSHDADARAAAAARELARALGCELREIEIDGVRAAYDLLLAGELPAGGDPRTGERVQARIRSNVLMALAHASGWLLLSTGNKSELACGYSTLYGETFGGFAPLKDVTRSGVVRLAAWRQSNGGPIPATIMERPHDGLRPDQWQADGLPPFERVDPILVAYVEGDEDPVSLCARGEDPATVRRVVDLVERAESKRRQTPPGVRISARAFGRDRRMPIVHGFRTRGGAGAPEARPGVWTAAARA